MTHDDMIKLGVKWLQKPYANIAPYGHSSMTVIVNYRHPKGWHLSCRFSVKINYYKI